VKSPFYQTYGKTLPWHNGKWNYLFCDGHVELLSPAATLGGGYISLPSQSMISKGGPWTRTPND